MRFGAEALTTASQSRPIGDIEVALSQLHETDQLINGAITGAEVERTGSLFFHLDNQILAAFHSGFLRVGLNLCKVAEIFESFLCRFHPNGVKYIAWGNQDFATEHLIFGPRVPNNIDAFDKRAVALLDLVTDVD